MSPALNDVVQTGFAAAQLYDQHRPSYPDEAVDEFLKMLEVHGIERARVLDLAAGTGKFTEILAARPEQYEIIAVEPHQGMLDQLVLKQLKNVTPQEGTAEDLSAIPEGSITSVIVAQAFHWIANMTALKEIHRVLQPTGVLGLIWNIEDYNSPLDWDIHAGWQTRMREVIFEFDDNSSRFRHQRWRNVFDEQNAGNNPFTSDPLFGLPIGESSIDQTIWLPKREIWARYRTLSQIAVLEGSELERVERIFWDAIDAPEIKVDEQGRAAVNVKTYFAWTSKIPATPLKNGG